MLELDNVKYSRSRTVGIELLARSNFDQQYRTVIVMCL